MTYTGIIATEPELDAMAGEKVNVTGWTETNKNLWMKQVEGYLSSFVQYDIATNWATLNAVSKTILSEYAARYCGMQGIAYNMAGFDSGSLIEPEDMINIHVFRMKQIEKQITEGSVLQQLNIK